MRGCPLLRCVAVVLLLFGLLAGWSAQAFSLVITGACVASMDATGTGLADPMENSGDEDADMPCENTSPRCMGSLGCIISLGLPQASFNVDAPGLADDRYGRINQDRGGLLPTPELFPPRFVV